MTEPRKSKSSIFPDDSLDEDVAPAEGSSTPLPEGARDDSRPGFVSAGSRGGNVRIAQAATSSPSTSSPTEFDANTARPQEVTYAGISTLKSALVEHFEDDVGLPTLRDDDLAVLDEAMSMLHPSWAQLRVVEADSFAESEQSIVRGSVPLDRGCYSLRQKAIILKRKRSAMSVKGVGDGLTEAEDEAKAGEMAKGRDIEANAFSDEGTPGRDAGKETRWQDLPEIIFFWTRARRVGGNLIVCPETSMDRLIQAYMVCEIVEHSKSGGFLVEREGALMGVELGERVPSEQDQLQQLLTNYSYHDASVGVASLFVTFIYFGLLGMNDVNVLTLIAVAVVAGLAQEATWPWIFKHVLECSRIKDPIVRVAQCKRVHHHQGQLSGQAFLAIGLAVFGVYLELFPADDWNTPVYFRAMIGIFLLGMIAVLVINMVLAVEPLASEADDEDVHTVFGGKRQRLRLWASRAMEDRLVDQSWQLTLLVGIVWAAIIAAAAVCLPFGSEDLRWSIIAMIAVILTASALTINPGMMLIAAWVTAWLIPVGAAFVARSAFDVATVLISSVSKTARRMAREWTSHVRRSAHSPCNVLDSLKLVLQVLPLTPLLLVFVPMPFLFVAEWLVHLNMRLLLLISDLIIAPVSHFRLYPLLSDYGSVTWKMSLLSMDVEKDSMRTLLKKRVSYLLETGRLGQLVKDGTLPADPYKHLNMIADGVPRLGCVAVIHQGTQDRVLRGEGRTKLLHGRPRLFAKGGKKSERQVISARGMIA